MIAPEGGEPPPVPKSVGWFLGAIHDLNAAGQSTFLASASSTVDRIMPCCQTLAVDSNGTLSMPYGLPINGTLYQGKEILVNLGGKADSVPAMWARKEAFCSGGAGPRRQDGNQRFYHGLGIRARQYPRSLHFRGLYIVNSGYVQGDVMDWNKWNETMSVVADLLHTHGKKLGVCIQTSCGDNIPGWRSVTNPPCATLFRNMPWADKLTDMGTYTAGGNTTSSREAALQVSECPSPLNKTTKWCGLEGNVLNHLQPQKGTDPPQFAMRTKDGQYSAGLSPNSCTENSTVRTALCTSAAV
jgi:hypothetical protein